MHMLLLQELFSVTDPHGAKKIKLLYLKKIHLLFTAFERLIAN